MTDNNRPITPPPELVQKWVDDAIGPDYEQRIAIQAARWGANQELEACCEWVSQWRCMVGGNRPEVGLRAARRPKPPSLKEQALEQLKSLEVAFLASHGGNAKTESIRRALDSLPD